MTWRRCVARHWLAVAMAIAPLSAAAQAPSGRLATFRLRDSLAATGDTTALKTLEARTIDSARRNRDDALLHLRLGYVGLRLAELTGSAGHFRDAEGEFEWATQLQPSWPLGWYALGTAELAEADAFPSGIRALFSVLGRDLFTQPARDLARSAEVDSQFIDGVVGLGDEALQRGVESHLQAALIALRTVGAAPAGRNPAVLLTRGRIEREIGDVDSALTAFESLMARNRFDPRVLIEVARTRLAAGRISGVDPWYLGLAIADSTTLAMYRFDLSLVMSDSALRAFDYAAGQQRVVVARQFWESRDPEAIGGGAERLREHYRRIDYAHRNYPLLPPGHRYDSLRTFMPTGSRFDDRGRIYVRHGDPDDRTSLKMAGIPPNESWAYHRPAGDMLFNFAQPDSAQGYRMYESLLDIVGLGTAAQTTGQGDVRGLLDHGTVLATYGAGWTAQAAQELLYSRQKLSPIYRRMLSAGINGAKAMQQTERAAGRRSIEVGLQTDSWKFGYELPLTAGIDIVAVGSDATNPQVQVVFAIPGSSLYAPPSTGIVVYPIRTRVVIRDTTGAVIAALDTLRNFAAAHPIPQDGSLLGRVAVSVPPGNYTARVALETDGRGLVTKPRPVRVAAMSAPTIDLSDLALGVRSVPLPWRIGATDTAWINPLHQFRSSEPVQLYFEVGGVAAGAPYHAQLAILRPGQANPQLQIGYNLVAGNTPDRVRREIDIGRLGGGSYVLRVTVSTQGGSKVVRERSFTVAK